jgi:RimJ/RimL family protein N-acetyltransferase
MYNKMISIVTPRLHIKPHSMDNLERFHRWETDPELLYYDDDEPEDAEPQALDETRAYLEKISKKAGPGGRIIYYAIHTLADGAFIGYGMIAFIDHYHRHCKLGITIGDRSRWGQGYGREALRAVTAYCFNELNMHRIGAEIYSHNDRSIRLFEGLGFKREGALRENVLKRGVYVDELLYGLLEDDYKCVTNAQTP